MNDRDALFRTILENPDDDAPRLVFADWLEEHGEEARAEFIRVQCELAARAPGDPRRQILQEREAQLLRLHGSAWLKGFPVQGSRRIFSWRRGFVGAITLSIPEWLRVGARLVRWTPLEEVRFDGVVLRDLGRLAKSPPLGRVARIDLSFKQLDVGALEVLAGIPHLGRLRALKLSDNRLTADGIRALARSPIAGQLRELDLNANDLGAGGAEALAEGNFARLADLDLGRTQAGDRGAEALARAGWLAAVTRLDLRADRITEWGVAALAAAGWSGLSELNLRLNGIGDGAAAALAGSPALATLRGLDLADNRIGPAGARALAASPHLAGLTHLNLKGNPLGDAGVRALRRRFGAAALLPDADGRGWR